MLSSAEMKFLYESLVLQKGRLARVAPVLC